MVLKRGNPGCPCCDDVCKIDRLTAETEVTQDAIRDAEHPQAPYPSWLQAEVKASVGDTVKLYLAYDDVSAGDGLYVEFTPQSGPTNGTLKLYRKDDTQLGDTLQVLCAEPDLWHLITVCYDPDTDEFTACIDTRDSRGYLVRGQCVTAAVPTGFIAGRKAGYGGSGYVKNYRYERLWYYGTTGMETLCCKPSIATTQTGRYPGSGPVACFDLSAITSPLHDWTLAVMLPDSSYRIVTFHGPHSAAEVCSVLYNVVANEGYSGASYACNFAGDILCVEVGGDFAGEAIPTLEYPNAAVAVYNGDITSVSYTPGTENGVNARQTITLGRQRPCPFFLAFDDEQTAELSEESSAADIQTALEALTPIGAGNVTVTGDVGGPFTVEFVGTLAAQPIGQLVAISSVDDCLDCGPYYGDYGDYGDYGSCPQTTCHRCGSPSCTVVDEDFSDIEGDETTPGDMPCGWDASGTDWQVIDGEATGNGPICHEYDTTDGSYVVSATFSLGHLETQGDSVTVSLTHGDTTHSLTVTRVTGESGGDPDRLKYTYVPSDFSEYYGPLIDGSVTLTICPYHICNNTVQTIVENVVTPGAVCVSITQPTMSGAEDASLTDLEIVKSKEMYEDCPECGPEYGCTTTCEDYCKDSIWPSGWFVELEGLESFCCDVNLINKGYYAIKYTDSCHSYGFGDSGLGVTPPFDESNMCWGAFVSTGQGVYWIRGWLIGSGSTDPSFISTLPTTHRETVGGVEIYHPIRVDVYIIPRSEIVFWYEQSYTEYEFFLVVTISHLVARIGASSPSSRHLTFAKGFNDPIDCANLNNETLPFLGSRMIYNTVYSAFVSVEKCDADPTGQNPDWTSFYFWGTGPKPGMPNTDTFSNATVKLTAL